MSPIFLFDFFKTSCLFFVLVCPLLARCTGPLVPICQLQLYQKIYHRSNNIGHGHSAQKRKVLHGVKVIDGVEMKMIGAVMSIIPKIKITFVFDPQDI